MASQRFSDEGGKFVVCDFELKDAQLVDKFMERIAVKHIAERADIAGVVACLASDGARFVNGVNLPVDGGVTASSGRPPQA